jgi:hypothetical protein
MHERERNNRLLARVVLAGYNLGTFAAATELGVATVSRIVHNKTRPRPVTVRIICQTLNATPEELGLARFLPGMADEEGDREA